MAQRLDVLGIRADGSRVILVNQPSDSDALWKRLRALAQTAKSIDITRHATSPKPPPTPPVILNSGQRVVYFSAVDDRTCHEFAACGRGYTARLSADVNQSRPGGAYYASDEQIAVLRSGGGGVDAWGDGDQTPIAAIRKFATDRGLDEATAQFETPSQWSAFRASGLAHAIGNPAALIGTPYLQQAIELATQGRVFLIGEAMYPDPGYSAQGVPVSSVCFYCDRDRDQGGYLALDQYAAMPAGMLATCSVYTGGRMTAADWQTFRSWTGFGK